MEDLWNEIAGQNKAKSILTNICKSRRVPHAFLFSGSEGVGKFFTALNFSILLNSSDDEREFISAKKKIKSLQEPNIKLVFPLPRGKGESAEDTSLEKLSKDTLAQVQEHIRLKSENPYHKITIDGANTIKINSIREIKKFINLSVHEPVKYRMVFILDAHLMNDQAQNALLKSIEEPPHGLIFILLTDQKEKLLPTIHSRCQLIEFQPLQQDELTKILENYFSVSKKEAKTVVDFAEGSALKANELLRIDVEKILERTIEILRFSLARKYNSALKLLSDFMNNSSDESIRYLLQLIRYWFSDAVKNKLSIFDYSFQNYLDTIEKFNARFNKADITAVIEKIDKLEDSLNKNVNLNVFSLNLIFTLASLSIRR